MAHEGPPWMVALLLSRRLARNESELQQSHPLVFDREVPSIPLQPTQLQQHLTHEPYWNGCPPNLEKEISLLDVWHMKSAHMFSISRFDALQHKPSTSPNETTPQISGPYVNALRKMTSGRFSMAASIRSVSCHHIPRAPAAGASGTSSPGAL